MSGGSSRSSSESNAMSRGSSSSQTGVWGAQSGYLNELYAGASADLANPRQYGGNRYAGIGDQTQQALQASYGTFRRGEANLDTASQQFQETMGGKYLGPDSNQFLRGQFETGSRDITRKFMDATQSLGSSMEASGRAGSGAQGFRQGRNEEALATGLGDFASRLYGDNYGRERGIMANMAGQGAQIAGAGWQNQQGFSAAGDRAQLDSQGRLDDMTGRFQFNQNIRGQQLAEFRDLIGGPTMTSSSESEEMSRSSSQGSGRSFQAGLF